MNADTITLKQLDDIEAVLDLAGQSIRRTRLMAVNGDLGPDEAEQTVRETLETIKAAMS